LQDQQLQDRSFAITHSSVVLLKSATMFLSADVL
jgi:hypothetical protein